MKSTAVARARPRNAVPGTAGLLLAAAIAATGCRQAPAGATQGYIEAETVYAASPFGGRLEELAVTRGSTVQTGELLFRLEGEPESAALREAGQRLTQARARLANLQKGRRPSELATLEAQLARATASLQLAESELHRGEQLRRDQVISAAELDVIRSRRDATAAEGAALRAELETARLGAREDEVRAAEADVASLTAAEGRARWALEQKRQVAPTNALVQDTLYRVGEFVAGGAPVVTLLPPGNLKVRFFVPQPALSEIRVGAPVTVSVDGRATPLPATVSFVSPQAEFTPPVLYNQENRAKLVFMVEARFAPEFAARLHPGQPVDVRWAAAGP